MKKKFFFGQILHNFSQMSLENPLVLKLACYFQDKIACLKNNNSHYNRDLREQFRLKLPTLGVQPSENLHLECPRLIPANV